MRHKHYNPPLQRKPSYPMGAEYVNEYPFLHQPASQLGLGLKESVANTPIIGIHAYLLVQKSDNEVKEGIEQN